METKTVFIITISILFIIYFPSTNSQSVFLCYICSNCSSPFNASNGAITQQNCTGYCQV